MREPGILRAEGWGGERAAPVAAPVERRLAAALGFEITRFVHCGGESVERKRLFHAGGNGDFLDEIWRNF